LPRRDPGKQLAERKRAVKPERESKERHGLNYKCPTNASSLIMISASWLVQQGTYLFFYLSFLSFFLSFFFHCYFGPQLDSSY
jgi:hypothetical protein